jgi:hypothetical protein
MTIQQFIKHARRLKNTVVLEHAIVFHAAMEKGFVHYGKINPAMRKLRSLGYFTLDKKSCSIPGWNPTWHITDAGRQLVALQERADK